MLSRYSRIRFLSMLISSGFPNTTPAIRPYTAPAILTLYSSSVSGGSSGDGAA